MATAVHDVSYSGKFQRYGQYSLQFIDYNGNADDDEGDEDGNALLSRDEDDVYIGDGPSSFSGGEDLKELYLISGNGLQRTLFRWSVKNDPDAPSSASCNYGDHKNITGSGCLGTIEYLKLEGNDWGFFHDETGEMAYDGVLDTWLIDMDFSG